MILPKNTEVCQQKKKNLFKYFIINRKDYINLLSLSAYAYQPYNGQTSTDGIWIGFEDPETAGNKASYVKAKGLGGIAIFDLSTDDFRGTCSPSGDKFPIVKAAKYKL